MDRPRLTSVDAVRNYLLSTSFDSCVSTGIPKLFHELQNASRLLPSEDKETTIRDVLDTALLAHASNNRDESVEAYLERQTSASSTRKPLCGYMFQRNDIAFNCKTCQVDETCVLCIKCYQNGNHEGHEIFFHRTMPGGVCDCGDSEAWAPSGFCKDHGELPVEDVDTTAETLPREFALAADTIFEQIVKWLVEMAKSSTAIFDPEEVATKAQSRAHREGNGTLLNSGYHIRICNDDVHSDEDLILSLTQRGVGSAKELVRSIDANGSDLVARNMSLRSALTFMKELKEEEWLICVVDDNHLWKEQVALSAVQWTRRVCSLSSELLHRFCAKLFDASNAASRPKEPLQVMFLADAFLIKPLVQELYQLYLKLQAEKEPKLQFSIAFYDVYDRLMSKYFCGVGTMDESLFQYGVQIFTTPSIVQHLSTLGLLDTLLDTFHTAIDLAQSPTSACPITGRTLAPNSVASPHSWTPEVMLDCSRMLLKFHRYSFLTDNLGYVLNVPEMARKLLLDTKLLSKWMKALRFMQGMDPQTRVQEGRAHVTYESRQWVTAFTFHGCVSRLLSIVSRSLRHSLPSDEERMEMVMNVLLCFWDQLELSGVADGAMQMQAPPISLLSHSQRDLFIVKYDVLSQPVSYHYPMHTQLASYLMEAMYDIQDDPIINWKETFLTSMGQVGKGASGVTSFRRREIMDDSRKRLLILGLLEFPLRSLALSVHVQSGLWIRNGQTLARQTMNYVTPPWCADLRDLDLFITQVVASILRPCTFLSTFFDRFGLSDYLSPSRPARTDEKMSATLEHALTTLCWILTDLPPPLTNVQNEDCVLRREVVHRLSHRPQRISKLLDQTTFITSKAFGASGSRTSDTKHLERLESILQDVADAKSPHSTDESSEPTKYVLRGDRYTEYDPNYFHLSRSEHEKAQTNRQEALLKNWRVGHAPVPSISTLPPVHPAFTSVRDLASDKGLIGVLRLVLERAMDNSAGVANAVVHLLHVTVLSSSVSHVIEYMASGKEAFEEPDESRCAKRAKTSAPSEGHELHVADQSIIGLLVQYVKQLEEEFEASKSTVAAIYWLLQSLNEHPSVASYLHTHLNASNTQESTVESKDERRKKAQERALKAMSMRQQAFSMATSFEDMEEEEEDMEEDADGVVYRPPPPPDCIICAQKKRDEAVMYIGHAQQSLTRTHVFQKVVEEPSDIPFPPPTVLSMCGHAVHLSCWKTYFASVRSQPRAQMEQAQLNVAFDAHFEEFLCPLCQALSSVLVPHVPTSSALTYDERNANRSALEDVFATKQDATRILSWLQDELPQKMSNLNVNGEKKPVVQFATSVLDAYIRFRPNLMTPTAARHAVRRMHESFRGSEAQLMHVVWNCVSETVKSTQLAGISSALLSLEGALSENKATSMSSLHISALLNPLTPPLENRLGVELPEALESQMDGGSAKDDAKLSCVLRALRQLPLLFSDSEGFQEAVASPLVSALQLQSDEKTFADSLKRGAPLAVSAPLLSMDLTYLAVLLCGTVLTAKADMLQTLRSLCVLHMAQTLLQVARTPPEEEEGEEEDDSALFELMRKLVGSTQLEDWTPPRGKQLRCMFESSCLAFMREMTLLCRACFRAEQDPDASWSANFVQSLRLTTKYDDMAEQLGVPSVEQVLSNADMLNYLLMAASQLRTHRLAAVEDQARVSYEEKGDAEALLTAMAKTTTVDNEVLECNWKVMPPLPLRRMRGDSMTNDSDDPTLRYAFTSVRLVSLASLYTDLHSDILGKSKCRQTWNIVENPAICLVCGQVLCAGSDCCRRQNGMGACTYHALTCGAGVGMFFLMRVSSVLLVYGPRSSYFGSPYLDKFGEEDINLRRGRPLFLSAQRMKALQTLYATHQVANEVSRKRRTSDQFIRNNYY